MPTMTASTVVACPVCGQRNRIPKAAGGRQPVCGRCGAELSAAPAGPVRVTEGNYDAEVARSPLPVLLDCWAPWCGPCRTIGPIIDQLAQELAGKVKVAKLNVDENPRIAASLRIQGIPALKLIRGGQVVDEIVGAAPKERILRLVRPYLG